MFIERDLFSPEFAALEQAQMTRYLNMLKTDILLDLVSKPITIIGMYLTR